MNLKYIHVLSVPGIFVWADGSGVLTKTFEKWPCQQPNNFCGQHLHCPEEEIGYHFEIRAFPCFFFVFIFQLCVTSPATFKNAFS